MRKKQSKFHIIRAKQFEAAVANLLTVFKIPFIRIDYYCPHCGRISNKQNKGIPDFFCYLHDFAVECKTAGGKLTKEQKEIRLKMEAKGIRYFELRDTVDDLLNYLENKNE